MVHYLDEVIEIIEIAHRLSFHKQNTEEEYHPLLLSSFIE